LHPGLHGGVSLLFMPGGRHGKVDEFRGAVGRAGFFFVSFPAGGDENWVFFLTREV
jgi:hypothetical protein